MRSGILYVGLVVLGAVGSGSAQSADKLPRFEVASVKPAKPGNIAPQAPTPGRLTLIGIPMQALIQYAFRAPRYLLSGGPKWLESERYDIVATMPANTVYATRRWMMQDLLQERFHLVMHREKRALPVYALMQSRNGPKFQVEKREMREGDGRIGGGGPGRIGGIKVSAFDLAEVLSDYLDRPVLDETGIDGLFDFKLIWTLDETPRALNPAEQHPPVDPNGASIFAAIQEQLGLRMVPQRGSIDMLVIDRVDRVPSENWT
jgi:bla regulator protein blaR1